MPILPAEVIRLRPVIAETGPIGTSTTPTTVPVPVGSSEFILRHKVFTDTVNGLNHCFTRDEIIGFAPEELEGHIQVALQDNFIVEDGNTGRFCTGQVAWELKTRTQGYVYRKL